MRPVCGTNMPPCLSSHSSFVYFVLFCSVLVDILLLFVVVDVFLLVIAKVHMRLYYTRIVLRYKHTNIPTIHAATIPTVALFTQKQNNQMRRCETLVPEN